MDWGGSRIGPATAASLTDSGTLKSGHRQCVGFGWIPSPMTVPESGGGPSGRVSGLALCCGSVDVTTRDVVGTWEMAFTAIGG